MATRRVFLLISMFVGLVFYLPGCLKVDTPPQLEIIVLDEEDVVVSGAYVAVFDNNNDWYTRENPVQVWRRSGPDGKVVFIDLKETLYYVYVRMDGKDNSLGEISTMEPLQINQRCRIFVHIR